MKESPENFVLKPQESSIDAPLGAGLRADTAHARYPETMRLPDEIPVVGKVESPEFGSDLPLSPESVEIAHDAVVDAGFGEELKVATRAAGSPEEGMAAFLERHPKFRRAVKALELSLVLFSAAPAATASAETIFEKAGAGIERQVERGVLGGVNRAAKRVTDTVVKEVTGPIDDMAREQRRREQEKRRAETGLRSAERNADRRIRSFRGKIKALHDAFGREWAETKNKAALAGSDRQSASLRENESRRLGALCQSYLGKVDTAEAAFKSRMRTVDRDLFSVLRDGSGATRRETEDVIVGKERAQQEALARSAQLRAALEKKMRFLLGVGAENFENPLDGPSSSGRGIATPPVAPSPSPVREVPTGESVREVHVDDLEALLEKL